MTTIVNRPQLGGLSGTGEPTAVRGQQATKAPGSATLGIANLDQNKAAMGTLSGGMDAGLQRIIDSANAMGAGLDPGGQGQKVASSLPPAGQAALNSVAGALVKVVKKEESVENLNQQWKGAMGEFGGALALKDANALVQYVMRLSYADSTKSLQAQAEQTMFINEQKKQLRDYMSDVRNYATGLNEFLVQQGQARTPPSNWSQPPSDPTELAAYMDACAEYYRTHPHPVPGYSEAQAVAAENAAKALESLNGLIDQAALKQSATDVANRAAALYEEKFGCPLPDDLKNAMQAMLTTAIGPPEQPEKLNDALEFFAAYVSYSSDCATANGQFGQMANGYDDVSHYNDPSSGLPTGPSLEDFAYYLGADASQYMDLSALPAGVAADCQTAIDAAIANGDPNDTARGNLASGDRALIEEAFGMEAGTLSGASVQAVVEQAMTSENVTWKNEVLFGQAVTTQEIMDSIAAHGIASPFVETIFGELGVDAMAQLQTIQNWLNSSPGGSTLSDEARESLGLDPFPENATPDQIETLLKNLDDKLNTLGEDAQLANLELQDLLQKQQQVLQTLSNTSKVLFDTNKSIIQKMG